MAKDGFGNIVSDRNPNDIINSILKSDDPSLQGLQKNLQEQLSENALTEAAQNEFLGAYGALPTIPVSDNKNRYMSEISAIMRKYQHPNFEKGGFRTNQAGKALEEIKAYRQKHNLY